MSRGSLDEPFDDEVTLLAALLLFSLPLGGSLALCDALSLLADKMALPELCPAPSCPLGSCFEIDAVDDDEIIEVVVGGKVSWLAFGCVPLPKLKLALLRCRELLDDDDDDDEEDDAADWIDCDCVAVVAAALGTITFDELNDEVRFSVAAAGSVSFSGDDDGSLEPTSWVTGLYGGMVLTLPPFFCFKISLVSSPLSLTQSDRFTNLL